MSHSARLLHSSDTFKRSQYCSRIQLGYCIPQIPSNAHSIVVVFSSATAFLRYLHTLTVLRSYSVRLLHSSDTFISSQYCGRIQLGYCIRQIPSYAHSIAVVFSSVTAFLRYLHTLTVLRSYSARLLLSSDTFTRSQYCGRIQLGYCIPQIPSHAHSIAAVFSSATAFLRYLQTLTVLRSSDIQG